MKKRMIRELLGRHSPLKQSARRGLKRNLLRMDELAAALLFGELKAALQKLHFVIETIERSGTIIQNPKED